jgi:predicted deacetylase
MYLIRLDDASEYMDVEKWSRVDCLLDTYKIKPIVGIIPNNQDKDLVSKYQRDLDFWDKAKVWELKGRTIALHGYSHVYASNSGGVNPVNFRSEFAGLSLGEQREKIRDGIQLLQKHQLNPKIFFAPSHTFDINTLEALKAESDIRVISDTVANDIYKMGEFYFIPQQSGHVQNLPFKVTTFCYHPNNMNNKDFEMLEGFFKKNRDKFGSFEDLILKDRKLDLYDKVLRKMYFSIRVVRSKLRGI